MEYILTILGGVLFALGVNGLIFFIVCAVAPAKFFAKFDYWNRQSLLTLLGIVFVLCAVVSVIISLTLSQMADQLTREVTSAAESQGLNVTDIDWRGVTIVDGDCEINAEYDNGVFTLSYQAQNIVITPTLMSQLCE